MGSGLELGAIVATVIVVLIVIVLILVFILALALRRMAKKQVVNSQDNPEYLSKEIMQLKYLVLHRLESGTACRHPISSSHAFRSVFSYMQEET